jgi:hypothetical protein
MTVVGLFRFLQSKNLKLENGMEAIFERSNCCAV